MKYVAMGLLALALSDCGPKCLRGHNIPVWIPESYTMQCFSYGQNGLCNFQMPVFEPGYWSTEFVCDQYEVEKGK